MFVFEFSKVLGVRMSSCDERQRSFKSLGILIHSAIVLITSMQQQHVQSGAASFSPEAQPLQLSAATSLRERFRRLDENNDGLLNEQEISTLLVESGMESVAPTQTRPLGDTAGAIVQLPQSID